METNLLDRMLTAYREGGTTITLILQNKTRLTGRIRAFDSYVIVLEGPRREIVYRHAVASVAAGDEARRAAASPAAGPPAARPRQAGPGRPRPAAAAAQAPSGEHGLNTGMKEGLLKWMREQKAAK